MPLPEPPLSPEETSDLVGRLIRHLISSHARNRLLPLTELRLFHSLSPARFSALLPALTENLSVLGLELASFSKGLPSPLHRAEKLFLCRAASTAPPATPSLEDAETLQRLLILAAVEVGGGRLLREGVEDLRKSRLFRDVEVEAFLKREKELGYLKVERGEAEGWGWGWRALAEYGESLGVAEWIVKTGAAQNA